MPIVDGSLEEKVLEYRKLGYNKYIISEAIKKEGIIKKGCSASSVYRILRRYGESRIRKAMIEEKRSLIREHAGSLGHIDCHVLPKGVVKSDPEKRYYVLGCMDNYSRICWVEVTESVSALDACFAIVEVQSFGDGKGLTIRMSERVIIRKEFFNITLEERDVSYKVIIQDIREQYD